MLVYMGQHILKYMCIHLYTCIYMRIYTYTYPPIYIWQNNDQSILKEKHVIAKKKKESFSRKCLASITANTTNMI